MFAATEKMKGLWKPVAAFKADNVAKGVVDASLQEGMAANMFKGVYKAQVRSTVEAEAATVYCVDVCCCVC